MASKQYGGKAPDYGDRGPSIVATGAVMMALSTVAVLVRFWSRMVATRAKFWWDDAALLATLVSFPSCLKSCYHLANCILMKKTRFFQTPTLPP